VFEERWGSGRYQLDDVQNAVSSYQINPYHGTVNIGNELAGILFASTRGEQMSARDIRDHVIQELPRIGRVSSQSIGNSVSDGLVSTATLGYYDTRSLTGGDATDWAASSTGFDFLRVRREDRAIEQFGRLPARVGTELYVGVLTGGAATANQGSRAAVLAGRAAFAWDLAGNATGVERGVRDMILNGGPTFSNVLETAGGLFGLGGNALGALSRTSRAAEAVDDAIPSATPAATRSPNNFQIPTLQPGGSCFTAGTPLRTPEGEKWIENFRPGDAILSRPQHDLDAPVRVQYVEEVFERIGRILHLGIGSRLIATTAEHPFYVRDRGWTPAGKLQPGDELSTLEGGWLALDFLEDTLQEERVYNLRVHEDHTYFVGSRDWGFAVWAHNADYEWFMHNGRVVMRNVETGEIVRSTYTSEAAMRAGMGAGAELTQLRPVQATQALAEELRLAGGLPRSAQTVVLMESESGITIVAAGAENRLTAAQIALARQRGLLVAEDIGAGAFHAEMRAMYTAGEAGIVPTGGQLTTAMCNTGVDNCVQQLTEIARSMGRELRLSADRRSFQFVVPGAR